MSVSDLEPDSTPRAAAQFANTHWSIVLSAAGRNEPERTRAALEKLCRAYWPPLYAYARRCGESPHDAQDLTQEFFARLLEKNYLDAADPAKGRFRSFLLAAFKHFLANEWDKARAQKRGGGKIVIPIDVQTAETQCGFEPAHELTAESIYERQWALALLEQVMTALRQEYVEAAQTKLFEHLKVTLTEARGSIAYATLAKELGTTEGAIKVAAHRLRKRYRDVLRREVAQTVANPAEVDEEMRGLFAALAG